MVRPTLGYELATRIASGLPEPVAMALATTAAAAASRRDRTRRGLVARHLQRIHGPELTGRALDRAIRQSFASYARYWVESFRAPTMSLAELDATLSWSGVDHLERAVEGGKGAIIALPHLGGWDLAGSWLCKVGYPLTVVVEALEPPELFEWFRAFRSSLGMTVVPLGPEAGRAVLQTLRANGIVCLLSDRDVGGGGVEVEFFGERTRLPAGPVTLGIRTGAPVLPTAVYYDRSRGGHDGIVRPPLELRRTGNLRDDVAAGTQLLAQELETLIRRAPEQWHVMQPNWPSDYEALGIPRSQG